MVGWIKTKLGMKVGLSPGHIVLDGDPAPQKGHSSPQFSAHVLWPNGWMDQEPLGIEVGLGRSHIVFDGDPAPLFKGARTIPQFSTHVCCGQTA